MGNQPSQGGAGAPDQSMKEEAKQAQTLFVPAELRVLKETFKDLAQRSPGKTVDKETFLRFMPLPGIMGERLFTQFDRKNTGVIDYEEFICGLAVSCRGTRMQKMQFIFQLYDLTGDNAVSREELTTLLSQVPVNTMRVLRPELVADSSDDSHSEQMVEQAFEECDLNRDGRLSFEQFCMWVERTPMVENFLDSVLPYSSSSSAGGQSDGSHLPFRHQPSDLAGEAGSPRHSQSAAQTMAAEAETRALLVQARDRTALPGIREELVRLIARLDEATSLTTTPRRASGGVNSAGLAQAGELQGSLWKRGRSLRQFSERWAVLRSRCLYFYTSAQDTAPRGVAFLSGCSVTEMAVERGSKYFGIEIAVVVGHGTGSGSGSAPRVVYTKSAEDRSRWVAALRRATAVVPITEVYELGERLGEGRFSEVWSCRHRVTGMDYAVKVITKATIAPNDRELLRTEIAILKLVSHRNIVHLVDVFEDSNTLHIVMELLSGGELFDRIVGRARYSEAEARQVIGPILDAVAYLHSMGIVHRDLKPENVLCGEDLALPGAIKIADFGLSKLVSPNELMKMPCGTLSYVAPEVLLLNGYGKAADLWSVGVILYLLLRGKLPFDGKTKNEIIDRTIQAPLGVETDSVWQSLSAEARDLVSALLAKDPADRPTAREAMRHPWLAASRSPAVSAAAAADSELAAGASLGTPPTSQRGSLVSAEAAGARDLPASSSDLPAPVEREVSGAE